MALLLLAAAFVIILLAALGFMVAKALFIVLAVFVLGVFLAFTTWRHRSQSVKRDRNQMRLVHAQPIQRPIDMTRYMGSEGYGPRYRSRSAARARFQSMGHTVASRHPLRTATRGGFRLLRMDSRR